MRVPYSGFILIRPWSDFSSAFQAPPTDLWMTVDSRTGYRHPKMPSGGAASTLCSCLTFSGPVFEKEAWLLLVFSQSNLSS